MLSVRTVFTYIILIVERTAISALYTRNMKCLVFITEMKCLLRGTNWVFNTAVRASSLKG